MDFKILYRCKFQFVAIIILLFAYPSGATSQDIQNTKNGYSVNGNFNFSPLIASTWLQLNSGRNLSNKQTTKEIVVKNLAIDPEVSAKVFKASFVDDNNIKWFLTDSGIVSFNNEKWVLHNKNRKVPSSNINGIAFENNPHGQEIWMATSNGAVVATLPVDAITGATTYNKSNTPISSSNVVGIAVGKSPLRWFGTDKGISAFKKSKWLTANYEEFYPDFMFVDFPVLSMATDLDGDTLYIGTKGAGIARLYSNDVDGISGASVFAQWGPMILPSDKVYSIFIAPDGSKWFGTDMGAAKHTGQNSLENWTAYTSKDGLIDNYVQAIASDRDGKILFGTKGGLSVFDGSKWNSYTEKDGLISNNILCIALDKDGVIWLGTDKGVTSFSKENIVNYK